MSDLKPCPFCGGKAWIDEREGGWMMHHNCDFVESCWFETEAEAIEAWNTRAALGNDGAERSMTELAGRLRQLQEIAHCPYRDVLRTDMGCLHCEYSLKIGSVWECCYKTRYCPSCGEGDR